MLKNYRSINNILGWIVFIIASTVFILTAESSVSFWDCGEYIATAYKLQVGHPPGAPTFQLIGRIASLFAGSDVTKVALSVNRMSALCNGFTILFLFWSITMLGRKLATAKGGELNNSKILAIFGSGIVGALAYTFTDTFWFSGVEGEVYAMSSLCTAVVFWAILKWEQVADENYSYRWIILIGYIIGLSIGVHLLNLLTLPAMVLVVYFRKYKPSSKGIMWALVLSFVLVGIILWGIVPGIVSFSSLFERFFTNSLGTGFYVGTIFYFLLIAGLLTWGLWYSEKNNKRLLNTGLLALVFFLVGYSTFLMLPIRANVNTPINQNSPADAVSLLSYLNREQYGSNPLVYGQQFNTPRKYENGRPVYKDGNPVYVRKFVVTNSDIDIQSFFTRFDANKFIDSNKHKYEDLRIKERYEVSDSRQESITVYDGDYCVFFPRMWNMEGRNIRQYKQWAGITRDIKMVNGHEIPNIPTFGQNMKFFFKYQMWYMYGRYFMWNFVGRQTLDQGLGNKQKGEWISGIKPIDEARLGPQDMPAHLKNVAYNKYYFLPFILGLIGLFYQFRKDKRNGLIVLLLFFMTGIAIGIYLNMYAYQPRERDYAYAASFYAFAIWIGFGVYAIYDFIKKYLNKTAAAAISTAVCMGVPLILATENWKDHDRSNRYLVLQTAKAYLDSCEPNAILFANGDNDTFPLWYAQEVEGYRTDVRICNLNLMGMDWYIDLLKRKAYNGEPVPITMTKDLYQSGTRDALEAWNRIKEPQNIKNVMQEIFKPVNNKSNAVINTINFYMDVDKEKVLATKTVPANMADKIVDKIVWRMPDNALAFANGRDTAMIVTKAYIAMMDILANNNWKRPIYYVATTGDDAFFGLEKYFQSEGFAYRLVPIYYDDQMARVFTGGVNTDILYDRIMNKFNFSQYADTSIFLSEDFTRMGSNVKLSFFRLADALMRENKIDSMEAVLDRYHQWFPASVMAYNGIDYGYIGRLYPAYKTPDRIEKGIAYYNEYVNQLVKEIDYYKKFRGKNAEIVRNELNRSMDNIRELNYICQQYMQIIDEKYKPQLKAVIEKMKKYQQ